MKRTNRIKVYLLIAILSLFMIFAIACTEDVSVTGLSITGMPENGIVTITDTENTLQLGVKFDKGNGKVLWTSGDEDVATIDGNGKVMLIDSGVVVITATFADNSEIKSEALLTVKDERSITDTITLTGMPETNTVAYSDVNIQLSATCSDASATLVWHSSNEKVATVNSDGLVTFTGAGNTDITVYKKGQRAVKETVTLTVISTVETLRICDVESGAIIAGYDFRLNSNYSYALKTEYAPWDASPFELEWSVDDENIAKIDENGVITGKEIGTVTVTAQVKGNDLKATKTFNVVKLNDKSEDFMYAKANRCLVNGICTDAWLDYTGTKVTSHNTDIFIDSYDENKKMLVVEKNTDFAHWTHVCFGSWNLTPGKYIFTVDLEVVKGDFQGKINGAQYKSTSAEYEYGIRSDTIGGLDFGKLSDIQTTGTKYAVEFELDKNYENFGIELYDDCGTSEQYTLNIKSFSLELADFAVNTDVYSDGVLIIGEEYTFEPEEIAGCEYSYRFAANGENDSEFIELKDGKLIPKKIGKNIKLNVSTVYNGKTLEKNYEFSVIANPFDENEDDYSYVTDVTQLAELVYDVRRTSVYLRTYNWKPVIETYNGGKTLKLTHEYAASWEGSAQFMLGRVQKGTYEVSFTLRGDDIGKWDKFHGHIYPIIWNENYKTTFGSAAYTRGSAPYGDIYTGVRNGNVFTSTITITEDADNFGIELCGGTEVDYTIFLDAFKFKKLPDITSADISGVDEDETLKSGDVRDLNEIVTYENKAESGQPYTCEWTVAGSGKNGGSARIIENKNGKKQLQCLKPGAITLTLKLTSSTGEQFTVTRHLTVELGEISINSNMYSDNILVKGASYDFEPIPLTDDMTFVYKYKTAETADETDTSEIVEIKDGKLIAKKAGTVYLVISSEIDGLPIGRTLCITVKEYGGTTDENYGDAINPAKHGDFYDIERTNVYLRAFNMSIEKTADNKLKFVKAYVPASGTAVSFYLGNIDAGRYRVTLSLGGDLSWDCFKGYLYALNWGNDWQTIFTDKAYAKSGNPYGNIHEAGFCLYSGSGNSTTGGTYTMFIDVASAQTNFGLMLETWGTENKAFSITLESFAFVKEDLTKELIFTDSAIYGYNIDNYGAGIAVIGKDGSMAVTKAATGANVANGSLQVVTPTAWSEIALCFGRVKAGTYTLRLNIEAINMSGAYWFTGLVYSGVCVNGKITYNGASGLVSSNAAEVTHAAQSKTVTLQITVAEDTDNFALILASKGDCGQAVNVQLSDISLTKD